jgi:hypothetical protein
MCKTLDRILMCIGIVVMPFQIRPWIGIKMAKWKFGNGSASKKTMPIHNIALKRLRHFFSKLIFYKELVHKLLLYLLVLTLTASIARPGLMTRVL